MSALEQFWWNWAVQAFVAVATLAAVLVALRPHLKLFPPKLKLTLRSADGEATTVQIQRKDPDGTLRTTDSAPARYYHVELSNERPLFSATDVEVFLVGLEVADGRGGHTQLWSGAIPLTATHYGVHPERTLGASPQQYDLCSIVKDRHFHLHPRVFPNNLPASFLAEGGTGRLRVTLQARSLEVVSPRVAFEIEWDGEWADSAMEMRRHMVVKQLNHT